VIRHMVLAAGLVLSLEGLVLALVPGRIEDALAMLTRLPVETRRALGLMALAAGVAIVWMVRAALG